jgi:heme-degrading monooxygenase HmoA
MHAVIVRVTIHDEEPALEELRERVVPSVSQQPGFVTGYWTRKDNSGLSIAVFESEDAANAAREGIRDVAPDGVTIEDVEFREVVANA